MTLGDRIKRRRRAAGLTQDRLAELVGVSRQAVAKWEGGLSLPSAENLFKLAKALGCSVDLLEQLPAEAAPPEAASHGRSATALRPLWALGAAGIFAAIFLLVQLLLQPAPDSSLVGLLSNWAHKSYLWGWLLHRGLYWMALGVSALGALVGKARFSGITCGMFYLGLLLGELLGPSPALSSLGQGHFGWAVWGAVYLSSIPTGIIWERQRKKGGALVSRSSALLVASYALIVALLVLLVLLSRPAAAAV